MTDGGLKHENPVATRYCINLPIQIIEDRY